MFKNRRKEESQSGVSQQILTQLLLQIDNLHTRFSQASQYLSSGVHKQPLEEKGEATKDDSSQSSSCAQNFVFVIGATNLPEVCQTILIEDHLIIICSN